MPIFPKLKNMKSAPRDETLPDPSRAAEEISASSPKSRNRKLLGFAIVVAACGFGAVMLLQKRPAPAADATLAQIQSLPAETTPAPPASPPQAVPDTPPVKPVVSSSAPADKSADKPASSPKTQAAAPAEPTKPSAPAQQTKPVKSPTADKVATAPAKTGGEAKPEVAPKLAHRATTAEAKGAEALPPPEGLTTAKAKPAQKAIAVASGAPVKSKSPSYGGISSIPPKSSSENMGVSPVDEGVTTESVFFMSAK